MSHSIKIDVQEVIASHNANSPDGSLLVLLPSKAVEFAKKIASDNGQDGNVAAAVGSIIAQAEMYHGQYEANMIERFVNEGRVVEANEDHDAETAEENDVGGLLGEMLRSAMGPQAGMFRHLGMPGMGMGAVMIEADNLEEALDKLKATFTTSTEAKEPDEVVKAREILARHSAGLKR